MNVVELLPNDLPHTHVYTRIGPSAIHGVGVLAIMPIARGTAIFPRDTAELRWIHQSEFPTTPSLRKLYTDFSIRKGDYFGCPQNFGDLNAAWYLNHSADPNVVCDADFQFHASRDILPGEELTVDYRTFSEGADPATVDSAA